MIELKNIDPEDISLLLRKIELSFGFRFNQEDLTNITTFGQLCDVVANSVHGNNSSDCTTQQAFYKLRVAIAETLLSDRNNITPDTNLLQLFPKQDRRQRIRAFHKQLGFSVIRLEMRSWFGWAIFAVIVLSLAAFFFNWRVALGGLACAVLVNWIANRFFANELASMTVGQLAEKLAKENYLKARRNPTTINRSEIEQKVRALFSEALHLEESLLSRDATFN
jgi:hypothetical protein